MNISCNFFCYRNRQTADEVQQQSHRRNKPIMIATFLAENTYLPKTPTPCCAPLPNTIKHMQHDTTKFSLPSLVTPAELQKNMLSEGSGQLSWLIGVSSCHPNNHKLVKEPGWQFSRYFSVIIDLTIDKLVKLRDESDFSNHARVSYSLNELWLPEEPTRSAKEPKCVLKTQKRYFLRAVNFHKLSDIW